METLLDLSGPKLSREVVDGFIWKIVHIADDEFDLYLNMGIEDFGEAGERSEDGKCGEGGKCGEDGNAVRRRNVVRTAGAVNTVLRNG